MAQILTFDIAHERYALNVAEIEAVEPEEQITRVPGIPTSILGVADWRGKLVAVLDLRPLFGMEPRPAGRRGYVVIAKEKWHGAALAVDAVDEIVEVDLSSVEPPLATLSPLGAKCLAGGVRMGDRLVGLLDLEAVLEAASVGNSRDASANY